MDQGKLALANGVQGYIRRRADQYLEAVVTVPGRAKIRRATGCVVGQEEEARHFLEVLLGELEELSTAAPPPNDELTFRQWGERWIAERKSRGVAAAFDEEAHLEFHAFPELGANRLRDLTKGRMLAWVRGLPQHTTERFGKPLSPRYVHHVAATVRRLMSEAVDQDLLVVSPCVWRAKRDLPPKMDKDPSKRRAGGFQPAEVWSLLFDERLPQDRRVLYALEFLTGTRSGEAAARRWRDWDDQVKPLGRLEVATAWNTRTKREKGTKTLVEKVVPVHPILDHVLRAWKDDGWKRFTGRAPTPDDFIVPATRGGARNASRSNKLFQQDLRTLELRPAQERRTHYETRSTFRSLALAGGAVRSDLDLITHPSPRQASDLYTRLDVVWPALCRAVACVEIAPAPPSNEEVTRQVTRAEGEKEKAPSLAGLGPIQSGGVYGTRRRAFPRQLPLKSDRSSAGIRRKPAPAIRRIRQHPPAVRRPAQRASHVYRGERDHGRACGVARRPGRSAARAGVGARCRRCDRRKKARHAAYSPR